jgi:transketolase
VYSRSAAKQPAAMSAAQFKLSNIVVMVDNNKCMIDGRVKDEMNIEPVDKKFEAFGFNVCRVDGHNMKELNDAIEAAIKNHQDGGDKPTAIILDTFKGAGVDFMQDNYLWHYGSLDEEKEKQAFASLDKYYQERVARAEKEA